MVKLLGTAVVVAAVAVSVVAARKPDTFHISRRVVISAPPDKVFPYLEDPKMTAEWSPWEKKDPSMRKSYSGSAKGRGAIYEWDGNKEVGAGRLEIVEVLEPYHVVMDLQFKRPMQAHNTARYMVTRVGSGTEVVWSIEGPSPFTQKVMSLFMDFDKMVGADFEKGLADLKLLAER